VIIHNQRQRWLDLILTYRGSELERIKLRLAVVLVVAIAVTYAQDHFHFLKTTITVVPFSLVSVALGIFLGFRNNASYDRYWEGRKLWGSLVNGSRNLSRQALLYVNVAPGEDPGSVPTAVRTAVHHTIAFVHALRMHLRGGIDWQELAEHLPEHELARLKGHQNVPIEILAGISRQLRAAHAAGQLHAYHLPQLDQTLCQLTDIQGACERIRNTPIPHSYTVLIHRCVAIYCLGLPFGLVDAIGNWTPAVALFVAYAFLGLDAVGDEIEDPFGSDPNDLPLSTLSRTIELNLRQSLGETERLPKVFQPVDGVLT
jgi:putative membrane protein